MVQGSLKKAAPATAGRKPAKTTRPGVRQVAPKKANLIKQRKLTKKLTSGLVGKTERSLATKAGHLEILAGGKKDRLQKEKKKAQEGGKKA
ncbi:hypothetical protein PENARI_c012G09610 [Penicillium arizonense]|uniref:Uncharacterized protein n=1 Tax=Penicillium arizonense TaxID=1835702 RepID=A0A1F5LEN8_PENAI|nr:hypothetical protein PENARI_c012G09610 [Penicillium arizonense]OGE51683.1 hypothetical protein PENARI_c012G09610 [Penicillium arizonense]